MTRAPIAIGCRPRAVAVLGFLARDTVRQAIVRAERLTTELIRTIDRLFALFPLDEENKAQRARAVDQRARMLAESLDAQAARDSNGDGAAWRLKPCSSLMFVNGAGELDQKHDQDLRDTCVMLWPPPVSTHCIPPRRMGVEPEQPAAFAHVGSPGLLSATARAAREA